MKQVSDNQSSQNLTRSPNVTRHYSHDEVERILSKAIERKSGSGEITHEQLLEVAYELGLDEHDIQSALVGGNSSTEFEEAKELWHDRERKSFYKHCVPYFAVNGLLVALNFATTPGFLWSMFPAVGWGIGFVLHGFSTFFPAKEDVEKGARRILRRRRQLEASNKKQQEKLLIAKSPKHTS